jgi:2-iminobutanoate/2-iminopropanoate deaminase
MRYHKQRGSLRCRRLTAPPGYNLKESRQGDRMAQFQGRISMFQVVATDKAPQAVGPYSQAVIANGFVFLSGQIPIDPQTGTLVEGTIGDQTRRVLNNLSSVLKSVGTDLSSVVKTTVFMKDLGQFDEMNKAYAEFFTGNKPARATVEVLKLPKGAHIEIEAIALMKDSPN